MHDVSLDGRNIIMNVALIDVMLAVQVVARGMMMMVQSVR